MLIIHVRARECLGSFALSLPVVIKSVIVTFIEYRNAFVGPTCIKLHVLADENTCG